MGKGMADLKGIISDILVKKKVPLLFHANTVLTSCTFLENKAFLSRQFVEDNCFKQTGQKSDAIDKAYGIYDDVFFDKIDIHDHYRAISYYGPVTFVVKSAIITQNQNCQIWMTRTNPMNWHSGDRANWFSKNELANGLKKFDVGQQLVIKNSCGNVPFGNFIEKIILADPKRRQDGTEGKVYSIALESLTSTMRRCGLAIKIERRVCPPGCLCQRSYERDKDLLKRDYYMPRLGT